MSAQVLVILNTRTTVMLTEGAVPGFIRLLRTKETFLADGWLRTGDQITINENGDIFVIDRLKVSPTQAPPPLPDY